MTVSYFERLRRPWERERERERQREIIIEILFKKMAKSPNKFPLIFRWHRFCVCRNLPTKTLDPSTWCISYGKAIWSEDIVSLF